MIHYCRPKLSDFYTYPRLSYVKLSGDPRWWEGGIQGFWGVDLSAQGCLESLTHNRHSSVEFCHPILDYYTLKIPVFPILCLNLQWSVSWKMIHYCTPKLSDFYSKTIPFRTPRTTYCPYIAVLQPPSPTPTPEVKPRLMADLNSDLNTYNASGAFLLPSI